MAVDNMAYLLQRQIPCLLSYEGGRQSCFYPLENILFAQPPMSKHDCVGNVIILYFNSKKMPDVLHGKTLWLFPLPLHDVDFYDRDALEGKKINEAPDGNM